MSPSRGSAFRLPLTGRLTPLRGGALVVFVALAAFGNSLGNGFAYDDGLVIKQNPVVTRGRVLEAFQRPYWPRTQPNTGLYRPVTTAAFALEWKAGGGSPFAFHLANVLGHAAVSLLVFILLLRGLDAGPLAAALGAGIYAVHPVHVEAVANGVGEAEVLAALFFLAGCLLYLWKPGRRPGLRAVRLVGIGLAYALSLGSKEIGATLPGALLLLELLVRDDRPFFRGVLDELPVFALLTAILAVFFGARYLVIGSLLGEVPASAVRGVGTGGRILTALTLWPEYLRLLVFPLDLSADYGPAVLLPATGVSGDVILGAVLLGGLLALAVLLRRRNVVASTGIGWFCITILPVSQLLFPAGVLLAERTLYLPSVGLAMGIAAAVEAVRARAGALAAQGAPVRALRLRRGALACVVAAGWLLTVRTVLRNPVWFDDYDVMGSLVRDHPESYRSARAAARGLLHTGKKKDAAHYYDLALALNPHQYQVLLEAAALYGQLGDWDKSDSLLHEAESLHPAWVTSYQLEAGQDLARNLPRRAHRAAAEGILHDGNSPALWSLLSDAWVRMGDLPAAVRSREMALGANPDSVGNWSRLAALRRAVGDSAGARSAERRARELEAHRDSGASPPRMTVR